ncbi:MAG: hypothetical protein RL720_137 [Actinomycetota bacterium]|jgi:hypothetical protein
MDQVGLSELFMSAQKTAPKGGYFWRWIELETATIALIPTLFHALHERATG